MQAAALVKRQASVKQNSFAPSIELIAAAKACKAARAEAERVNREVVAIKYATLTQGIYSLSDAEGGGRLTDPAKDCLMAAFDRLRYDRELRQRYERAGLVVAADERPQYETEQAKKQADKHFLFCCTEMVPNLDAGMMWLNVLKCEAFITKALVLFR